MNAFPALWRREMGAYFRSPIAYGAGVFFLLAAGAIFWMLAASLAQGHTDGDMAGILFGSPWYWPAMLLAAPLLTMRLFAEEHRMGTLETLMTAPVTEAEVVLAKFAGAYVTFLLLWTPTLAYGLLLNWAGASLSAADWGPVAGGYLGTMLIGAYFLSMGLLCSLLTRHQIVAAMACLAVLGLLLSADFLALHPPGGHLRLLGEFFSLPRHMLDFSAGVIDTRAVIWYVGATILLLFFSVRILEARRLR